MDSSPEKTKRRISGTGLTAFGFTSKKLHIDTAGNLQPSASTPVDDSSTHLVASLSSFSSPSLVEDDITSPLASSYIPSVPIQTQMEMNITDSLSSSEVSAEMSSNKSIPNDISASINEPPTQPQLGKYLTNCQNRSFQYQWYRSRPWLEYSISNDSTYCYICRHFGSIFTNKSNRFQSDSFSTTGFNGWKRALEKNGGFQKHSSGQSHIQASANFDEYQSRIQSGTAVLNVIDKSRVQLIRHNREKLIKISTTVLLCAKQMIALRGHNEEIE